MIFYVSTSRLGCLALVSMSDLELDLKSQHAAPKIAKAKNARDSPQAGKNSFDTLPLNKACWGKLGPSPAPYQIVLLGCWLQGRVCVCTRSCFAFDWVAMATEVFELSIGACHCHVALPVPKNHTKIIS